MMDEHVLRGNTAVIKCHIPSFVADYVFVSSWLENDNEEIYPNNANYGTQALNSLIQRWLLSFGFLYYILLTNKKFESLDKYENPSQYMLINPSHLKPMINKKKLCGKSRYY